MALTGTLKAEVMKQEVSEEEIQEAQLMCEEYLTRMKRLDENNQQVKDLREKLEGIDVDGCTADNGLTASVGIADNGPADNGPDDSGNNNGNPADNSEFFKSLYEREIKRLTNTIQQDEESTGYFRWALEHLEDKDRWVIQQLYVDGCSWSHVVTQSGKVMSDGAISAARKRSFRDMAKLISWIKDDVA